MGDALEFSVGAVGVVAALVSAVGAAVSAWEARKSREAAERSESAARRERNRPTLEVHPRSTRQVALFAVQVVSDRDLESITIQHMIQPTDDPAVFMPQSGIAPELVGVLRRATDDELPDRDVPNTSWYSDDTLAAGPVRAGDPMDLLFRSVGFDPRPKVMQGRARLRCTARVAGESDPYVIVLDTGALPLQ